MTTHRVILILVLLAAKPARADMAEESMRLATDSASTHLFPLNPAVLKPSATQAAGLITQTKREASLDHRDEGGDAVTSETTDESLTGAALVDFGAGAGLGLSHQMMFRKTETSLSSDSSRQQPREELAKLTTTTARLLIELTSELRAGVAMRYLFKDVSILGDPFLGQDELTRYKTTLIGYGAGLAYAVKSGGVSYTYYPPLRGKTEVYGEELIVGEPGFISLDGFYTVKGPWTVGLLAQRWLSEIDDLAGGTTSEDDQTEISLYGLDPDQYVFPQQLVMIGADYEVSKAALVRVSLGQEQAIFNFNDLMVYNRADVRGRGREPTIKYNRLRAALRFALKGNLEVNVGMGLYDRDCDFPEEMNGGSYEGEGREMYATLGVGL